MMSLALYRKYRPRTLGDIVGQEEVVHILQNAARQNRLAHAYLFYGPRGTGKTTTARLIAKLLNCETRATDEKFRATGEPCNQCRACREIDVNNSLDVVEIDAASNRGIEEIRNLKEALRISPTGGPYRVYIIDEAHMLTGAAFNALLKTLEEPPPHGVMILATTEYEKLPATITSRTQRFLFKKLSKAKILAKLKSIAQNEKIKIDPGALELIAAAGEGSFRDAESLLDQVGSLPGTVTLNAVEQLTGRVGLKKVDALAVHILENNLPACLEQLASLTEEGHNLVQFTRDLIHYLRRVLALHVDPQLKNTLRMELTENEVERLGELAALVKPEAQVALLRALITAYGEMRYSPFALVPLEIALIENLKQK